MSNKYSKIRSLLRRPKVCLSKERVQPTASVGTVTMTPVFQSINMFDIAFGDVFVNDPLSPPLSVVALSIVPSFGLIDLPGLPLNGQSVPFSWDPEGNTGTVVITANATFFSTATAQNIVNWESVPI